MNLFEYQGKRLYKDFSIPTPKSIFVSSISSISDNHDLNYPLVVKAQVQVGGRGKAGGIKVANNFKELIEYSNEILGMDIKGHIVESLLIEEASTIQEEYYISFTLDRSAKKYLMMLSSKGGMDIEEVADKTPHLIFTEEIDPKVGLQGFQCRKIAFNLGLSGTAFKEMTKFVSALYAAFDGIDAALFEINPVLKTSDDKILAVDSKVALDGNALYRHKDYAALRDKREEDPTEVEAGEYGLNFVKLDGNVGCMVNGAGLAMATMDIIKQAGGNPANFLDVGGTADAARVEQAFRIIMKDEGVKAILVNIFGGIVRCDRVAQGVVDAYKNIREINIPIIVRLQGTNAVEAKKLIDESGLKVISAILLQEAADKVKEVLA